jgi:hypothetical protein
MKKKSKSSMKTKKQNVKSLKKNCNEGEIDWSKAKRVNFDFSKVKIESAPTETIDQAHPDDLDKLLCLLGHPESYCTDESSVGDFCLTARKLKSVSKKLGFEIKHSDLLIDVMKKMV